MNGLTQGSIVTLALFIAGLIYHAGAMAQRVAQLEKWREEMRGDVKDIKDGIAELQRRRYVALAGETP